MAEEQAIYLRQGGADLAQPAADATKKDRETDKSDRRVVKVSLTPSAKELPRKIISAYRDKIEHALSMLNRGECEKLISYHERRAGKQVIDANDPVYNQQ
ncbi:MAG: hypothetical protein DRI01_05040 [Chloroflexi bacterium]|nr:MAG: hypothetical protein DRI01_05040 [Chloroflexota bacterium]